MKIAIIRNSQHKFFKAIVADHRHCDEVSDSRFYRFPLLCLTAEVPVTVPQPQSATKKRKGKTQIYKGPRKSMYVLISPHKLLHVNKKYSICYSLKAIAPFSSIFSIWFDKYSLKIGRRDVNTSTKSVDLGQLAQVAQADHCQNCSCV